MKNKIINVDQDSCWVCEARFRTALPAGPAMKEAHHIFPRNAGGNDGPIALLCDSHHSRLHKIANRIHTEKPFADLLLGETEIAQKRLAWLGAMVVKAERSVRNDPNKQFRNGVMLNTAETQMMEKIQSIYSGKSRSDIFKAGLYMLYQKHFRPN